MIAGARYVLWQKRTGILAMVCLVGALLSLADALVGGFGGSRGVIELLPDSRYQISGPMPPRTEAIKDFVIDGEPKDGSVRLLPEIVFSGYWLGGSMWRGLIVVAPDARQGDFVIAVKDRFGEKQNPSLVFTVRIWPDEATLHAHSASFLTRKTGRSPYLFAVSLAVGGLLAGAANFLFGRLWAWHLKSHHCGEIYKLRRTDQGTEITCELPCGDLLRPGMEGAVYRSTGEPLCTARIARCDNGEVLMMVAPSELVRLGDVACAFPETTENPPT
ncbi:hypothetical protein [Desulfobulbus elongatus]|uniref:hypothetical protein n=1 Tax=Desulfobulbus elongatus TaxID=53332 RepID=UPI000485A649|nr:hypothetical protein [Desulfobulbus elongatus]